jgi:GT2 family glycosyltransferase
VELATFFAAGMVISGGAVYYHLSGHSKRKPNIFNYLHRNANKLRFFVTKNAPANSMPIEELFREPSKNPEQ